MAELDAVQSDLTGAAAGRQARIVPWVEQHALVICLSVQTLLLFADLGRLPVWGDEQSSFDRAVLGLVPHDTVHPGLYFSVLGGWLSAVCGGGSCVAGARTLSALFTLAATVAVDRCWLRTLDRRERAWFLILWALSPALLLYGRMARSYSLQLLLAVVSLYAGSRYARQPTLVALLAYAAASTVLLHTHYLPAIAVVAGVGVAMGYDAVVRRRRDTLWWAAAAPLAVAVAFAPWLPALTRAGEHVAQQTHYRVFGNVGDAVVALTFTAVSFSVGEALWPWTVAALPVIALLLAAALLRGVRERPAWLAAVAPAAAVAFLGARQWVSYAFVAARLLFLLPFYLLLIVRGARVPTRLGTALCAALALFSLAGIAAYFEQTGFLNKAYVLPTGTIADAIQAGSMRGPATVILDAHSSDFSAVAARLPREARILYVADPVSAARAAAVADEPGIHRVWFVHSTHDVSPERYNALVTAAFARRFAMHRTGFAPYSALDRWLMGVAGWPHRPRYAIELVDMRDDLDR